MSRDEEDRRRALLIDNLHRSGIPAAIRIAELERLEAGLRAECHEVEQRLGRALGYPLVDHRVCERCDPATGCTCDSPVVCVGEHVPGTLAAEAATRIAALEAALAASEASRARLAAYIRDDDEHKASLDALLRASGDPEAQMSAVPNVVNASTRRAVARAALQPGDLA